MAEQQAQQAEAGPINVNAQAVAIQPLPEFDPDSKVGASWALVGISGSRILNFFPRKRNN